MLKNGGFDLGLLAWNRWVAPEAAAAEFSTDQGALRVDVKRPGKYDWQVQLTQAVPLAKGKTYTVSFTAWARRRRQITLRLNQNHPPYAAYAEQTFTVDREKKTYHFTATIDEDDANSRLEFDFGEGRGAVWLDNVSMRCNQYGIKKSCRLVTGRKRRVNCFVRGYRARAHTAETVLK